MDIKFSKHLRGRIIDNEIYAIRIPLETLITQLVTVNWDLSKINHDYKKVYNHYKLNNIYDELKTASKKKSKELIRENMLKLYGNDIGDNCFCIYIVAFCVYCNFEPTITESIDEYMKSNKIAICKYQKQTISKIGLLDGIFLDILNKDGTVKNENFFSDWIYCVANNTFDNIISDDKYKHIYLNRYLIFNNIDFNERIKKKIITQHRKKRIVYEVISDELKVTLKYLKKQMDLEFNIKYANRTNIMTEVFQFIENCNTLGEYTIYRFDFKDFFDSVNSIKVYNKYILNSNLRRYEKDILYKLVNLYNRCYAGFPTSNAFTELIGRDFDDKLKIEFKKLGLCYYARYVDDGILLFNQKIEKSIISETIDMYIKKVFEMSTVKINNDKTKYMTKYSGNTCFDYLGYKFEKANSNNKLFLNLV